MARRREPGVQHPSGAKDFPRHEDLRLVAAMAAAGDFSPLTDGYLLDPLVSPPVREVLHWIEQHRREGSDRWPPTLEALNQSFPHLPWPRDVNARTVLLPPFLAAWIEAAKGHQAHAIITSTMGVASRRWGTPEYHEALERLIENTQLMQRLGSPNRDAGRVGGDMEALRRLAMQIDGDLSPVGTPWKPFNDQMIRFYPGVYMAFSRPKNGKSWWELALAIYNGIHRGLPGVLIDLENNLAMALGRLVAMVAEIPYLEFERLKVQMHQDPQMELTYAEKAILARAEDALRVIEHHSKIHLLTMDHLDPVARRMSTDRIAEVCKEIGAVWLCADQVHKYYVPGITTDHTSLADRVSQVVDALGQLGIIVFGTTQENREGTEDNKVERYTPSTKHVYGSDGAAQLCVHMVHIKTMKLLDGEDYTFAGAARRARHLQCIWPLAARGGDSADAESRFWRLLDNCAFEAVLDNDEGTALFELELAKRDELAGRRKRRGKKSEEIPGVASPPARTSPLDFL